MDELQQIKNRLRDLADRSFSQNIYTYSGFLSLAEQEAFHAAERELRFASPRLLGGYEGAERCLAAFGSEETLGYAQEPPIVCVHIRPLLHKFADDVSHRDFLGALMNLGIDRSTLGDIKVGGKEAYCFCLESIAPFLCDNLAQVRHTHVRCEVTTPPDVFTLSAPETIALQTASLRIDAVIAKVYKLSRNDSLALFTEKKVYLNGRLCESNAKNIKAGDVINARGYGKFRFLEETGLSKKGKSNLKLEIYR